MKREKGLTRNFNNSSTITTIISHIVFSKNKRTEKENKKGESRQKTRNHFSRHRKTTKKKINVKHVQQKRETDKIVFWNR